LPEPLIPHAGARFVEDLELEVAPGGCALAWEVLTPGRAARGESLAYDRLEFRLRVLEGPRTVLLERSVIVPADGLEGPAVMADGTYYGILVAIGGEDPARLEAALRGVTGDSRAGVSRLRGTGVVLKALTRDSRSLHALLHRAREAATPILAGRPATPLRRT
ncbi:MAG TPA: urease accessory protein UreD, partial [Planctomycetota bacterium]|nr:urease accessory protein UreD [Planctomycetota bacterium]